MRSVSPVVGGINQVDTENTEFPQSFTEKEFMRFAQAAWFVHPLYARRPSE
jgi:hypothetical protein